MPIIGTSGNDNLTGTNGDDQFDMTQGGRDKVSALDGNDIVNFGATLTAKDQIDGGAGVVDTLQIAGDYSAGVVFEDSTMTGIEQLQITGDTFDYNLTFTDANTTGSFSVAGSSILAGHSLTIDASADTDTGFVFFAGAGNDVLKGSSVMSNSFTADNGGSDTLVGGAGVDVFVMGASFDIGDSIDGKGGVDDTATFQAGLSGTIDGGMMKNVEKMSFGNFGNYDFAVKDNVIAAGATLLFDAQFLSSGTLRVDAHKESDGRIVFNSGGGDDVVKGGDGNDLINFGFGNNTGLGGDGDDTFNLGASLNSGDHVDGGKGTDTVEFAPSGTMTAVFGAQSMVNVEIITLDLGQIDFTLNDNNIAAGKHLTVDGTALGLSLTLDAHTESDGFVVIQGGNATDTFKGGDLGDTFTGNLGADEITGGGGTDTFTYLAVSDSTSTARDTLNDFDADADEFDVAVNVTGVDAKVTSGALSNNHFDSDLAAAVGHAELARHHAVLFTPSSGGLTGRTYLIVDANGTAGYQAGADFVIELKNGTHLNHFDLGNFT